MKSAAVLLFVLINLAGLHSEARAGYDRAIMFIIDGLHVDAPQRIEMPHFNKLASQGTLIENTTVIMPAHPRHGRYAELHTSSLPNPMMMAGTVFLREGQNLLQHSFRNSAFVANSWAYRSLIDGYHWVVQNRENDAFVVEEALKILKSHEVDFIRIHLQNTGSAGSLSYHAEDGASYKYNIWDEDAPFVHAVQEADRLLGYFVEALRKMGKWDRTLLLVTSDHGQTDSGWHPLIPEESWLHPSLFVGPGIRAGQVIEWADQTDLAPTIAHLMDVPAPNNDGGSGRVLHQIRDIPGARSMAEPDSRILELNRVFSRYMLAQAELLLLSVQKPFLNTFTMRMENEFYTLDRILDWEKAGTVVSLIEHNRRIVERMEEKLSRYRAADYSRQREPWPLSDPTAGLIGPGGEGPYATAGPSFNPRSWTKVEGDALAYNRDVWGRRVTPIEVFSIPGGLALLYNSKPPEGYTGGARLQTGSIAFSRNMVDWTDYSGNPILYEATQAWQGVNRLLMQAALYDENDERWVIYFGDSQGSSPDAYPGIRAIGAAYSSDLIHWEYEPSNPLFTILDFAQAVPERMVATIEEQYEGGRVYVRWAMQHEGKFYIALNGSTRTGEGRTYSTIVMAGDSPSGPFEYYDDFAGDIVPGSRPVYSAGKWYTVIWRNWDGRPGLGLASADKLTGPYTENPLNPVIEVETISRVNPRLFKYDGYWAILYAHTYDGDTDRISMRMALAGIHPALLKNIPAKTGQ